MPKASMRGRGVTRLWVLVPLLGLGALVCHSLGADDAYAEGASNSGRLTLAPCRLPGVFSEVRCGTLSVPEDRLKPQGKAISLNVAVVPAVSGAPKPDPVFILAGGPGQAAAKLVGA